MQVGNFTKGGIPFALELFAVIKNGFPVSTGSMILNTSLGAGWARVLGTESVLTFTWHLHSLTHGVLTKSKAELAYRLRCNTGLNKVFFTVKF